MERTSDGMDKPIDCEITLKEVSLLPGPEAVSIVAHESE